VAAKTTKHVMLSELRAVEVCLTIGIKYQGIATSETLFPMHSVNLSSQSVVFVTYMDGLAKTLAARAYEGNLQHQTPQMIPSSRECHRLARWHGVTEVLY